RLFEQLDLQKTYMNGLTAGAIDAIKIPAVMDTERDACEAALKAANCTGPARVVWIKNTLELQEMLVSEALLPEVAGIATLVVEGQPDDLAIAADGALIRRDGRPVLGAAATTVGG